MQVQALKWLPDWGKKIHNSSVTCCIVTLCPILHLCGCPWLCHLANICEMLSCSLPTSHQCDILTVHYPNVSLIASHFSTYMQQCLLSLPEFWFWLNISSTKILVSLQPYAMTCTPRKSILGLIAFLYIYFHWLPKTVDLDFPVHMTALSLAWLVNTNSHFCLAFSSHIWMLFAIFFMPW